jgi:cell division septum initiation protein DivIVA
MSPRSRPIAQRARTVTDRIARLKEQLSGRTRDAFTSDSHYRTWHKKTNALLSELEDELSVLNEPGEYDQLPPAVVAEELGTTTEKVRQLIKGGEILATGKSAHEYVSREELAAACEAGLTELIRRLGQEAHQIFEESLEYLHQGHMGLAERACRRLVARESMAGSFALPYETAFHLARAELDEVEARLSSIGRTEDAARLRLMRNLRRALRGMSFKDEAARATAERLLGGDEESTSEGPKVIGSKHDELQRLAMFITTVILNEIDRGRKKFLRPGSKDELSEIIRSAVYSALYAHESHERLASSREFIDAIGVLMPRYYRPARLIGDLVREQETNE